MNGYTKELKLVSNGADIFDLWVVEDGKNNLYIGKIVFEALDQDDIEYCVNLMSYMQDFNY